MTTASSTDARLTITAALEAAGLPAFPHVPKTISTPAVIVIPDDPYLIPNRVGSQLSMEVAFVVACLANSNDTETAIASIEALVEGVIVALPDGVRATRVSRPSLDSIGAQGSVYVAEVTVLAQTQADATIPALPPGGGGTGGGTGGGSQGSGQPPTDGSQIWLEIDEKGGGVSASFRIHHVPNLDSPTPLWYAISCSTRLTPDGSPIVVANLRSYSDRYVYIDDDLGGYARGDFNYNGHRVTGGQVADWIETGTLVRISRDNTNPQFPVFTITDLHNPTTTT